MGNKILNNPTQNIFTNNNSLNKYSSALNSVPFTPSSSTSISNMFSTPDTRPSVKTGIYDSTGKLIGDEARIQDGDTVEIYKNGIKVSSIRTVFSNSREVCHDNSGVAAEPYAAAQGEALYTFINTASKSGDKIILDNVAKDGWERKTGFILAEDKDGNQVDYSYLMALNGLATTEDAIIPKESTGRYNLEYYTAASAQASRNGLGVYNEEAKTILEAYDKKFDKKSTLGKYGYNGTYNTKHNQKEYDLDNEKYANKFKIGDVWLDIPPTHVTFSQLRTSHHIPLIGFESKPVSSPVSRIAIKLNIIFTKNKIHTDLRRLLVQFRYCPFNLIRSKDLYNKLCSNIPDGRTIELDGYKQSYYIPVTMDEYVLYTIEGHSETLGLSMQLSLFNYAPYYITGEDDVKMEYFEYNETKLTEKSNINEVIKRTPRLENSCHPYNLIIEEELNKTIDINFGGKSEIRLFKVDNAISQAKTSKLEELKGIALSPEEFYNKAQEMWFIDDAASISIAYRNNFAWQPIAGYSNPTAQYLGPGDTRTNINIKTNNTDNISKLLKTYFERVKDSEYGFYDDRYFVMTPLNLFTETTVASISDIAVTSLDGHPGWSDVNIQLNKSSFEFDMRYNDGAAEYDEYWGLHRVAKIADLPEVKQILDKIRKEQTGAQNGNLLIDQIKLSDKVNTAGMDVDARVSINSELIRLANILGHDEAWIKNNIVVSFGKAETLTGNSGKFREFMNGIGYSNPYKPGDLNYYIELDERSTIDYIVDKAVENNWKSSIYNNQLVGIIDKDIRRGGPLSQVFNTTIPENVSHEIKLSTAKQYMNKWNRYASDGTILCIRYKDGDQNKLLADIKRTKVFADGNYDIIKNVKSNENSGQVSTADIGIHYKANAAQKHQTAVQKEAKDYNKLKNSLDRLSNIDMSKVLELSKPFAAHRYFPDIDRFVTSNHLYSSTIGSWFYTDELKTLSAKIQFLKDEVANCIAPTQDYIGYKTFYMQQNFKGLYNLINDSESPSAIIDGLTYPAKKKEMITNDDGMFVDVQGSKFVRVKSSLSGIKESEDVNDYPWSTFQNGAMASGFGIKYWGADQKAVVTDAFNQREAWINTHVRNKKQILENTSLIGDSTAQVKDMYNMSQYSFGVLSNNGKTVLEPATTSVSSIAPIVAQGATATFTGAYTTVMSALPENTIKIGYRHNPFAANEYLKRTGKINTNTTAEKRNDDLTEEASTSTSGPIIKPLKGAFDAALMGPTYALANEEALLENPTRTKLSEIKKMSELRDSSMDDISSRLSNEFLLSLLPTSGMENAFPTFKFYIIAEDTSEVRYYSLDDYYDYRLIQDFMVIRDRNSPVSILKARVIVDPRYITTNPMFNPEAIRSGNTEQNLDFQLPFDQKDTNAENKWDRGRAPLREGMRVCIKTGYATDPRALDTVFIGTIVSMNGRQDLNIYDLECHGDGRELTVPAVTTTTLFKANNFAGIIGQILRANTNVVHFGRVYGAFLERFSKKHHQLLELGMAGFKCSKLLTGEGLALGTIWWKSSLKFASIAKVGIPVMAVTTALYMGGPALSAIKQELNRYTENVGFSNASSMSAMFSGFQGWYKGSTYDANKAEQQYARILWDTYYGDNNPVDDNIYAVDIWNAIWGNVNFSLSVNARKSIWEILQTVQRMYPGFALDIRPYGNRSTLFLGDIRGDYWRTDDPIQAMAPALSWISGKSSINQQQLDALNDIAGKVGENFRLNNGEEKKIAPRIPFQKHHVVTSLDNIIVNSIKSTPSRGWNTVVVSFPNDTSKSYDENKDNTITVTADSDLDPGAVRTKYERIDFTSDKRLAEFYALGLLKEGVEKLYGGSLIVRGNPKIEPYDKVYICDDLNRMYGWIQVESVIHKFDSEMGFTTHIVPNMLCNINDDAYVSQSQIAKRFFFKKFTGNMLSMLGTVGVQFAISTLLPVGWPALLATAAVIIVSSMGQYYYDKTQTSNDELDKQARPESLDLQKYYEMSMVGARVADQVRYGIYGSMAIDIYREAIKPGKNALKQQGITSRATRIYDKTKGAWGKVSTGYKAGKTALEGEKGAEKLWSIISASAKTKGIPLAKNAIKKGGTTTLGVIKKASPLIKKYWITSALIELVEMGPLLFETFMAKYAKRNNTIIVHPMFQRNRLMVAGLEGYKNNDTWMHVKDMAFNAKRYLSNTLNVIDDMYSDVQFAWGSVEDGVANASTGNSKSAGIAITKHGAIKDSYVKSIDQNAVAIWFKQQLIKANGQALAEKAFASISKLKELYNLPWDLISSIAATESSFNLTILGSPIAKCGGDRAAGLFQVVWSFHYPALKNAIPGITQSQYISNPVYDMDGYMKVALEYMWKCYKSAYNHIATSPDAKGAENTRQAIYEITYLNWNAGVPKKIRDIDKGLISDNISVSTGRGEPGALSRYNGLLNSIYDQVTNIRIKKG